MISLASLSDSRFPDEVLALTIRAAGAEGGGPVGADGAIGG